MKSCITIVLSLLIVTTTFCQTANRTTTQNKPTNQLTKVTNLSKLTNLVGDKNVNGQGVKKAILLDPNGVSPKSSKSNMLNVGLPINRT